MLRETEYGWREIIGFFIGSLTITIGIAAIAILTWMILCAVVALPTELAPAPWLPDPATTPGEIDDNITAANLQQTICNRQYRTGTVRPDVEYTNKLKTEQLLAGERYGDKSRAHYEEDHLIPLELGGNPSDPKNLWPEFWNGKCGAHVKDKLENELHDLVCAGKLGLFEARGEIATDWVRSYNLHVGPLSCP